MALPNVDTLRELVRNLIIEINPSSAPWLENNQVNLIEVGALDSISIVSFIQAFEERLDITFNYVDFQASHFQTIDLIVDLLNANYS